MSRRAGIALDLLLLLIALAMPGCNPAPVNSLTANASGVPSALAPSPPAPTKSIQVRLILPRERNERLRFLEQSIRGESGRSQVYFEIAQSESNTAPPSQAELIRNAVRQGVSALIIVPEQTDTILPALAEARDKGVHVVTVGRSIEVGGKPFPVIALPSYADQAKVLVAAAQAEAKVFGFPAEGPAVMLVSGRPDSESAERIAALEAASNAAGVRLLGKLGFSQGSAYPLAQDAQKALSTYLKDHPEVGIVLADDDMGLSGAVMARAALKEQGRFPLAGFSTDPKTLNLVTIHEAAAVVNMNAEQAARTAVRLAIRLARGEAVPDQTPIEALVRRDRPRVLPIRSMFREH